MFLPQACRRDFPALSRTVGGKRIAYLDGPAGTQVPTPVIEAVAGYYRSGTANSHGQFLTSRESDRLVEETRETVAAFLGAGSGSEISFGQNMTSLAFALSHALSRSLRAGDEVVVTQLDHEANRGPWIALTDRGVVVREIPLRQDGTLDETGFARQITPRTKLVAMGLASNALGTVSDVALARKLATDVGAWLLLDAVHYAPHFAVDAPALGADFLLCSAYKFYGPHVGILYSRPGLLDQIPTDRLCTQDPAAPWKIETGTLNHAALAGVKAAIEYLAAQGEGTTLRERIVSALAAIGAHERALAVRCDAALRALPGVRRWGPDFGASRRAPTLSVTIQDVHATEAARRLGERGVQVWDGHFYAARAVEALKLTERGGLLRAGFVLYNDEEDVDRLVAGVREIAAGA